MGICSHNLKQRLLEEKCGICYEKIPQRFDTIKPCSHSFCDSCLSKQLQSKYSCPICKSESQGSLFSQTLQSRLIFQLNNLKSQIRQIKDKIQRIENEANKLAINKVKTKKFRLNGQLYMIQQKGAYQYMKYTFYWLDEKSSLWKEINEICMGFQFYIGIYEKTFENQIEQNRGNKKYIKKCQKIELLKYQNEILKDNKQRIKNQLSQTNQSSEERNDYN